MQINHSQYLSHDSRFLGCLTFFVSFSCSNSTSSVGSPKEAVWKLSYNTIYLADQLWNQSEAHKARFDCIANSSPSSLDI